MSSGGKTALVIGLLLVAGVAGWYWYTNYSSSSASGA